MYRRYSGVVPDLPVEDGIRLINFAFEKETEDRLFTLWVGSNQCAELSFNDFKERLKPIRIDEEATLERLDELMESAQWAKG